MQLWTNVLPVILRDSNLSSYGGESSAVSRLNIAEDQWKTNAYDGANLPPRIERNVRH